MDKVKNEKKIVEQQVNRLGYTFMRKYRNNKMFDNKYEIQRRQASDKRSFPLNPIGRTGIAE